MDEQALRSLISLLNNKLDAQEVWLYVWTLLVIVGCAGELISVIHKYKGDRNTWFRARTTGFISFPEKPSGKMLVWDVVSVALVVIGICGELFIDWKSADIQTQLRDANGNLILLLGNEAGDASNSAASARIDADAASDDLIRLRKETGARRLTEKQKRDIGGAIASMPTPVAVAWSPLDSESGDFANDFIEALKRGNWPAVANLWFPGFRYGIYLGATDKVAFDIPQTKLLLKALKDAGIEANTLQLVAGDKSLSPPAESHVLYLLVGPHPPIAANVKKASKIQP